MLCSPRVCEAMRFDSNNSIRPHLDRAQSSDLWTSPTRRDRSPSSQKGIISSLAFCGSHGLDAGGGACSEIFAAGSYCGTVFVYSEKIATPVCVLGGEDGPKSVSFRELNLSTRELQLTELCSVTFLCLHVSSPSLSLHFLSPYLSTSLIHFLFLSSLSLSLSSSLSLSASLSLSLSVARSLALSLFRRCAPPHSRDIATRSPEGRDASAIRTLRGRGTTPLHRRPQGMPWSPLLGSAEAKRTSAILSARERDESEDRL